MITRRNVLIGASATLVCAPAVIRVAGLMPIRRIILPTAHYYGFVERLFLSVAGPPATELINAGFSAEEAAREMSRRKIINMNSAPWEARHVLGVRQMWREVETSRQSR